MAQTNSEGIGSIFKKGILTENTIFVGFLGMCPTLAVTRSLNAAVGMALVTVVVLVITNTIVSMMKSLVPKRNKRHFEK